MPQLVSIAIPCFNEEPVIGYTIQRLQAVANQLPETKWEMIFVDDGSSDDTVTIIAKHATSDSRIRLVRLSRNFGHQAALSAGLDLARGDAVILIDADLQDPPELIPRMIELWAAGHQVVYGQRTGRERESIFKSFASSVYYRLLSSCTNIQIPYDTGDFRLIDRKVVDILKSMPEKSRYLRGMISWIGFSQIAIHYQRQGRFAGESKYSFSMLMRLASDGLLSFSTTPVRATLLLGLLMTVSGAGLPLYLVAAGTPTLGPLGLVLCSILVT
jgi:glycosyltransferase involved in cell wall biosynthesis